MNRLGVTSGIDPHTLCDNELIFQDISAIVFPRCVTKSTFVSSDTKESFPETVFRDDMDNRPSITMARSCVQLRWKSIEEGLHRKVLQGSFFTQKSLQQVAVPTGGANKRATRDPNKVPGPISHTCVRTQWSVWNVSTWNPFCQTCKFKTTTKQQHCSYSI